MPLLDWDPPPLTKKLSGRHVMASNVVVFKEKETVGHVLEILSHTKHHGFPVVLEDTSDEANCEHFGLLKGFILRHQLLTLLKKKVYLNQNEKLCPQDFRESYPRYINIKDVKVEDDEKSLELDLRPYMSLAPYSLTENCNLPRIFRLFRGLGLRHLVIVNDHNQVVGIVTRVDIAKFRTHIGLQHSIVKELSVSMRK
jgi:chloride channel 7